MRLNSLSAEELYQYNRKNETPFNGRFFHERTKRYDRSLKAFISLPEKTDSPGIPYALKDNIMCRGTRTTCASQMLWNYDSVYDATVVKRLRSRGFYVMGKTNMDEFSMGSSTGNSAFFSTRNPWNLKRSPGGSSGGSAVAVSTMMVPFALGSDSGGSIRIPASFCGVVGYKPTYSLISRYGLVEYASSFDQIGPITRSVRDAAFIVQFIAGGDENDSITRELKTDLLKEIETPIEKKRIAIINELTDKCSPEIKRLFNTAVEKVKWTGATVDEISLSELHNSLTVYHILSSAEASSNLNRFDGINFGLRVDASGHEALNVKTRSSGFGPEVKRRILLGTFVLKRSFYADYYKKAQLVRALIAEKLLTLFKAYDAVISPTSPILPPRFSELKDPLKEHAIDSNTVVANLAGLPALSIPMGMIRGLPVGIQLMGAPFHDHILLQIARNLEKSFGLYEDGNYPVPSLKED